VPRSAGAFLEKSSKCHSEGTFRRAMTGKVTGDEKDKSCFGRSR
jgi:hypothetical protein